MNKSDIETTAERLYQALRDKTTLSPLSERFADMTIEDAYYISLEFLAQRQSNDGERLIGKKIGVTSAAVQNMLGVHQPDFGFLTDAMQFPNHATVSINKHLIQPRAEGEIAFKLAKDLPTANVDAAAIIDATESVYPCFEIVDSRIKNWRIKIQDTIADNASCGVFVLGDQCIDPRSTDLSNLRMQVFKNGALISEGQGSAVQGSPQQAVAWLANTLGNFGICLKAGDIILSGSWVPLEPVVAGDELVLNILGLGAASIRFS